MLEKKEHGRGMDAYIASLERNLEEFNRGRGDSYRIGMSYGISDFDPAVSDKDKFLKELDDRMYGMKSEHHKINDASKSESQSH